VPNIFRFIVVVEQLLAIKLINGHGFFKELARNKG
jgi:hypothetical protein